MTTRTTYERGRSGTSSGGAAIMRDATDRPDGPGPDIMDAATLKGDKVVNGARKRMGLKPLPEGDEINNPKQAVAKK